MGGSEEELTLTGGEGGESRSVVEDVEDGFTDSGCCDVGARGVCEDEGGGGWGDPFLRDAQLVSDDVNRGLVSVDGALRYGVVIVDGAVDEAATEKLRAELVDQRGDDIPLFNYGGTVEEIKARCLEETHLPAPVTPVFRNAG